MGGCIPETETPPPPCDYGSVATPESVGASEWLPHTPQARRTPALPLHGHLLRPTPARPRHTRRAPQQPPPSPPVPVGVLPSPPPPRPAGSPRLSSTWRLPGERRPYHLFLRCFLSPGEFPRVCTLLASTPGAGDSEASGLAGGGNKHTARHLLVRICLPANPSLPVNPHKGPWSSEEPGDVEAGLVGPPGTQAPEGRDPCAELGAGTPTPRPGLPLWQGLETGCCLLG